MPDPRNGSPAPAVAPIIFRPNIDPPMMQRDDEFPFLIVPETNPVVVGANSTLTTSFIVDGQTAFVLETLRSTHSGGYRLLLSYGSGSGQLMNAAAHVDLLMGTAQRPGFFSRRAWMLPQGSRTVITAQFTNVTGVVNTIEPALCGYRKALGGRRTEFTGSGL